jgi:hypothetical protein
MTDQNTFGIAGLLGCPVAHSRSPVIHNHWLAHYGIPGRYVLFPVPVRPENPSRTTGHNGRSCRITLLIVRSGDAARRVPPPRPPCPGLVDALAAGSCVHRDAVVTSGGLDSQLETHRRAHCKQSTSGRWPGFRHSEVRTCVGNGKIARNERRAPACGN